ncbi:MAG: hypothetical protein ACI4C1_10050 [Lachnospiraceae bacterium]
MLQALRPMQKWDEELFDYTDICNWSYPIWSNPMTLIMTLYVSTPVGFDCGCFPSDIIRKIPLEYKIFIFIA